MDARIDLTTPRIKEDGVTVWYGRTAYRNCHVKAVAADERTITLSTSRGLVEVDWFRVPQDARAKLYAEYSKGAGQMQEVLRRAIEDRENGIDTFRNCKVQARVAEGLLLVHGKSLLFLVNHPRQRDFLLDDKISPFTARRRRVHKYDNAVEGTKIVQKYEFIEESF